MRVKIEVEIVISKVDPKCCALSCPQMIDGGCCLKTARGKTLRLDSNYVPLRTKYCRSLTDD